MFFSTTAAVSRPSDDVRTADFPSSVKSTKLRISVGPVLIQLFQGDFTSSRIRISFPPSGVLIWAARTWNFASVSQPATSPGFSVSSLTAPVERVIR